MRSVFQFVFVMIVIRQARGVQITELRVPRGASHEAPMDCRYDLEADLLYDVKWYKDGQQFFRCLPSGEINDYPLDGVKTVHSGYASIGSCQFHLTALDSKSAGEYKCEVTTEGPAFKTAARSSKFRVIVSSPRVQNETNGIVKTTSLFAEDRQGVNTTWNAFSSEGYAGVVPTLKTGVLATIYLLFCIL